MDYETFKEKLVEDLRDRLYEQGVEVDISVTTVNAMSRRPSSTLTLQRKQRSFTPEILPL